MREGVKPCCQGLCSDHEGGPSPRTDCGYDDRQFAACPGHCLDTNPWPESVEAWLGGIEESNVLPCMYCKAVSGSLPHAPESLAQLQSCMYECSGTRPKV